MRLIELRPEDLRGLRACLVAPERVDWAYLAAKSLGLNLALRAALASTSVLAGGPAASRAAASMAWYQLQDAIFTLYGRSYMNVLARASGALRVAGLPVGDLALAYLQCALSELLCRLMLGPAGDTPWVLSPSGLAVLLLNVAQGLAAGGSIVPAINQARRAGAIGESAAAHLYQLSGLTIHSGLLATFGYQALHGWVTGLLTLSSWLIYAVCSSLNHAAIIKENVSCAETSP